MSSSTLGPEVPSTPRIALLHGIRTDGSGNVDSLMPVIARRGWEPVDVQLERRGVFSARYTLEEDTLDCLQQTLPGDHLVAHSNGARIALESAKVREYSSLTLIRPAASKKMNLHDLKGRPTVLTLHSPEDFWVSLGARLLWHPFGLAGAHGFEMQYPEYPNFNVRTPGKHSDDFAVPLQFDYLWSRIHELVTATHNGPLDGPLNGPIQ